jgi:hypothetical protein
MNELFLPPLGGVPKLRFNQNLLAAPKRKTRVAVFGSFYGGYHVLSELLEPPLAERVTVVGVATDDPTRPFVHADVRLWKYPHTRDEELLVPRFATAHGLPVYTGRVKTPEFERMFVQEWKSTRLFPVRRTAFKPTSLGTGNDVLKAANSIGAITMTS